MSTNRTEKYCSAAILAAGMMILTAAAEKTNDVPFADDFEVYTNRTPLIDGTNGWYASSNAVIVQTNIVYTNGVSAKAASIPPDCFLSNRFNKISNSNIWLTMHIRPARDNLGNAADYYVTNNQSAVFYVNTGGYCVAYNGTNGWNEFSELMDGGGAPQIGSNEWGRIDLRLNTSNHTWALFVNHQLLSTNLAFADSNYSSFAGFEILGPGEKDTNYPASFAATSYLDNVLVDYLAPSDITAATNNWRPFMEMDLTNISRTIWKGQSASSNSFHVWKSAGCLPLDFTNTITYTNCGGYTNWLSITPANDTSHGEQRTAWIVLTNTVNLPVSNQPYQALVQIDGADGFMGVSASNSPQSILVSVLVQGLPPSLQVLPLALTNTVTAGHNPPGQNIYIANTSATPRVSMTYAITSDKEWITPGAASGSVVDETNEIALAYSTAGLAPGWHTGVVTVTASGIATQQVQVVMRVNSRPGLAWTAGQRAWTNIITEGTTLPGYTFEVWNSSGAPTGTMQFALSDNADWISLSPVSGESSGDRRTISVTYNVASLAPGGYTGTVTLAGTDEATGLAASNSPLKIVADLLVRGKASLAVDTDSLSNSVMANCSVTNLAAFNVWNDAGVPRGGLNYSITSQADWLSISPSSGLLTNETDTITVIWSAGSRAPGTYNGSIIVDATDELSGSRARNAPWTINVRMTVLSRSPSNYEKPTIYGAPYIGQTFTARKGLWQNMDRLTFTYQWQRANDPAGNGLTSLAGEITSNHVITAADRGKYLRIAVTATDPVPPPNSATAYSDLEPVAKIRAAPDDFDGDGIADLWFFDPATGMWRGAFNANAFAEGQFGWTGVTAVPADYNGDGILDLAFYENAHAMWYVYVMPSGPIINGSLLGGMTEETQATPVPADYDGDGCADVALYWRGYWAILYSSLNRIVILPPIAGMGAVPAPEDYDGDRLTDIAVYDSGLWTVSNAFGEVWSVSLGSSAWLPVPGDYDGDNIADIGVYSQVSNIWKMIYSSSGAVHSRRFGSSSGANLPRQGYYDHDPYCDPAAMYYSADGDFLIWCVTRTSDTNFTYRGQSYQKSINNWRVSW